MPCRSWRRPRSCSGFSSRTIGFRSVERDALRPRALRALGAREPLLLRLRAATAAPARLLGRGRLGLGCRRLGGRLGRLGGCLGRRASATGSVRDRLVGLRGSSPRPLRGGLARRQAPPRPPRRRPRRRSSAAVSVSSVSFTFSSAICFLTPSGQCPLVLDRQDAGDLAPRLAQTGARLERAGRGLEANPEELLPASRPASRRAPRPSSPCSSSAFKEISLPLHEPRPAPAASARRGGAPRGRAARERRRARTSRGRA